MTDLVKFAPVYQAPQLNDEAVWAVGPFVTSLQAAVYSFRSILPPQLLGALFSRASRAAGDLREVLWSEYLGPILYPKEETQENLDFARELREVIQFYHDHPNPPYNTKRAYQFFAKWLAQYGDDSIAQMGSTNLVACGLSQPGIKFIEDQRVGLAPIEKSTRYVDFSRRTNGWFGYFTDPRLQEWGFDGEYRTVMDGLFEVYTKSIPVLIARLQAQYPEEKTSVLEKKAFDELRGFLPMATLSQVAFHGNAQAFQYLIVRCMEHPLGELRWFASLAREALDEEIPSLLLRLDDEATKEYAKELQDRKERVATLANEFFPAKADSEPYVKPEVRLAEADPEGENKVITGLLFPSLGPGYSWQEILSQVRSWPDERKKQVLDAHFAGRKARWQKVGRAFENAFVRFEITMNLGAYRDLHRHRMHTQDRQLFTAALGYEMPSAIKEFGLEGAMREHMEALSVLFQKIEEKSPDVAQYVPSLFHFVRFYQYQNAREFFWEVELRTGPQGRPDYRWIEQEKYRLLQEVWPLLMSYVLVDMNEYDLARRGTEERIAKKEKDLTKRLGDIAGS